MISEPDTYCKICKTLHHPPECTSAAPTGLTGLQLRFARARKPQVGGRESFADEEATLDSGRIDALDREMN